MGVLIESGKYLLLLLLLLGLQGPIHLLAGPHKQHLQLSAVAR